MENKSIELILTYQESGVISTKHVEEWLWLNIENVEWMDERVTEFKKAVKKTISLFNRDKVFNVEVTFMYGTSYYDNARIALIHRDASDRDGDIYTLYTYPLAGQTDVCKVSKSELNKRIMALIDKKVSETLEEIAA